MPSLGAIGRARSQIEIAQRLFGRLTRTADRRDRKPHLNALGGRADALGLRRLRTLLADRPHAFEIVVAPHFGAEQMHDHVAGIDQNPIALRQAFDTHAREPPLLQTAREILGERRDMATGAPCPDDDRIAQRRAAGEVDRDDVFSLVVVEGGEDARQKRRVRWERMSCRYSALRVACGSGLGLLTRGWSRGSALHQAKTGIRGASQSLPQLSRSFVNGYSPQEEQYHRSVIFARRKPHAIASRSRGFVSLL